LDWRAKVELFEQIRREYEFGIGTIAGVAKKLGVHRRMVREAIGSALPKPRKKPDRLRWKLKTAVEFVDAILEADRKAPRKQRHTAHRIWARMQQERPECKIAERTVREYVHDRKIALGLNQRQTCVPQSYAWAWKRRSIGTKPMPILVGNEQSCRCSRCAVWPAERRFIAPICMRRSRRFWKRTSWRSPTLAVYFASSAMTT
jgi:hypothetical protein